MRKLLLIALLMLPACGGGLSSGGMTPPAVDGSARGVDGLEVGHRLMEAGEYELALKAYYRAAAEDGMSVDVLSAVGSADLKLGRLNQAEQVLRRALTEEPTFVPALNNLGVVLMEQGKFGEAKAIFQQAFELDSGNSDSIRQNLKLAIARSEKTVYGEEDAQEAPKFNLVRRGTGDFVLLSQL
nr:tetratricopeptide repeat protein [Stagnihabitans tardus]